jgi:FKBP-type peptidyl-prolyl cis-trans isomerase
MKQGVILTACAGVIGLSIACGGGSRAGASTTTTGAAPPSAGAATSASSTHGDDGVSPITSLQMTDAVVGTRAEAANGHTVSVHYAGWLYSESAPDHHSRKFDSSRDRNEPLQFHLGAEQVIKGWDRGVAGMKVGGQRTLVIPPDLGYGSRGAPGAIPPNATLLFDVELLGVRWN